jgi:hypothetical protein
LPVERIALDYQMVAGLSQAGEGARHRGGSRLAPAFRTLGRGRGTRLGDFSTTASSFSHGASPINIQVSKQQPSTTIVPSRRLMEY